MVELAKRRYDNRFDFQAAEMWVRNIVLKQPMVFLPIRTDDAFLVGLISVIPWLPAEWEAGIVMVCAEPGKIWQAMALIRESLAWAKRRRCTEWRLTSETAADVWPLAKRLGVTEISPRYVIRLG
jgi:hypothetical protein